MTQQNARELAKQGDPNVIASLINPKLQPKGINAIVTRAEGYLHIFLESSQISGQQKALVDFIGKGVINLGLESIHTVKVYGQEMGQDTPVWEEEIQLAPPPEPLLYPEDQTVMPDEHREEGDYAQSVDDAYYGDDREDFDQVDNDHPLNHYDEMPAGDYDLDEEYGVGEGEDEEMEREEDEGEDDEAEGDEEDEEEDEDEDESQSEKKKLPLLPIALLVLLVPVVTLAALHFTGIFPLPFLASSKPEPTPAASPSPKSTTKGPSPAATLKGSSPTPKASPASTPTSTPKAASPSPTPPASPTAKPAAPSPAASAAAVDPWREAVNKAQKAANLTQGSRTRAEWQEVAQEWQESIRLLKQVPASHPKYREAQQKAGEYQTNLDYATKAAANAPE